MRKIFFTPGPTELYYTVEGHIKTGLKEQIASISHRGSAFKRLFQSASENLRLLLNVPEGFEILFTSSATEVWEHLVRSCAKHESAHLVNGAFSRRAWEYSGLMGLKNEMINAVDGSCSEPNQIKISDSCELIMITHNESSTGVAYPIEYLKEVRRKYPKQIIAIDAVSSAPIPEFDFDDIDSLYFSVQKSFCLPAGLGVWIVGPKCIQKSELLRKSGTNIGTYRALPTMIKQAKAYQTVETPNILGIYLLGKVAGDMLNKGIDQIRRESKYKAAVLYQTIQDHPNLEAFVDNPKYRSETVVVAKTFGLTEYFINELNNHRMVISSGYGEYKTEHIRIANFPTHSKEIVEKISDLLLAIHR
ncbi:MAG: aminotransferase class V-fold PLP-dependent enzyme [Bacteroidetes bacterium]|nr:aminotransferase class V-fold PLP-dependent enzyme [Bacteroidota bacterium]